MKEQLTVPPVSQHTPSSPQLDRRLPHLFPLTHYAFGEAVRTNLLFGPRKRRTMVDMAHHTIEILSYVRQFQIQFLFRFEKVCDIRFSLFYEGGFSFFR